jgi:hypothetical protein
MSTVTTRSERCASLGSMGNLSGTRYPSQSAWSLAVPHRETSHKSHWSPTASAAARGQDASPPEGVNPGDFKADDSNTGRDGCVALHHRLEPRGAIFSLPLSLWWPRALLRASLREVFLSTTWGHGCGGSLCVGLLASLVTSWNNGTHLQVVMHHEAWVRKSMYYEKSGDAQSLLGLRRCVGNRRSASPPIALPAMRSFQDGQ